MAKILQKNLDILERLSPTLSQLYHVRRIGIFGSTARNQATPKSDVDVLVEFNRPVGMFAFLELENFLSRRLKKRVDLVTRGALKPIIKKSILKDTVYV